MPSKTLSKTEIKRQYKKLVKALLSSNILIILPKKNILGIVGIDGREYPMPTEDELLMIFDNNKELVRTKAAQGFSVLRLTPLAMASSVLINLMETVILKHASSGKIYQMRKKAADPLIPARVNPEKQVWVWERLKEVLDTGKMIYFPKEYSNNHQGLSKIEAVKEKNICAFPGWSVSLAEETVIMPEQGKAKKIGGRKQLEIGCSPREYLKQLKAESYQGETGWTLEDFITNFIISLETKNEVSHDVADRNGSWCLAQYWVLPYAEVVPAGRWIRKVGRARLDSHRTGNKLCAKDFGAMTMVRLSS